MLRLSLLTRAALGLLACVGCTLETGGLANGVATGGESADPPPTTTAGSGLVDETDTPGASGSATGGDPTSADSTADDPTTTTASTTDESPDPTTTTEPDPPRDCTPLLVEALTSLDGSDDGREWVVLHNPCDREVDLASLTLAWGGYDYDGQVYLQGTILPGGCLTVGGPTSDGSNFSPSIQVMLNFEPNLSREPGAIGLFLSSAADIDLLDVPLDVVIYGNSNPGFLDPSGAMPGPMLGGNVDRVSMRRTSAGPTWEMASPPTPSACPSF